MADLDERVSTHAVYSSDPEASWRNREAAGAEGQVELEAAHWELAAKEGDRSAAALERQKLQLARVERAQAAVGRARVVCAEAAILGYRAARTRRQSASRRAAAIEDRLQGASDPRWAATHRTAAWVLRDKQVELDQHREEARDGAWILDDRVVQVLYGLGMTLQAALAEAERPGLRDQLERAIAEIDELVGMLRSDMGQLRRGESRSALT